MHTTSRSVVAAARAHPAGVAAPSAVIATAIVLLTFVTTVIVPSLPPGLFGAGSAPAIQPGPSQQRHRVLPQHPVPTGPPILPVLPGALGRGAPGAASKPRPGSSPMPPSAAGSPPGSGPAPGVNPHPSPGPAGGCPACTAGQTPAPAVTSVVAGAGKALQSTTQVLVGSVVPAATGVVAAATVTGASHAVQDATQTVTSAASGTVQAASSTLQGASQAHGNTSQGGSAVDSVQQALPAAGSLPGVG